MPRKNPKILIADSGSTKTDWAYISEENILTFQTEGLNPYHINREFFDNAMSVAISNLPSNEKPDKIYFFGAGCSGSQHKTTMETRLKWHFPLAKLYVESDLYASCYALCNNQPGIVVIWGTGSNVCLFDGTKIVYTPISLGYLLGDEGSGNHCGKLFLQKFLRNHFSNQLLQDLRNKIPFNKEQIIAQLYNHPQPAKFLGSFLPYIHPFKNHPEIKSIFFESWNMFYNEMMKEVTAMTQKPLPVYFNGSVAYYFQDILKEWIQHKKLILGKIINKPMPALIEYFKNKYYGKNTGSR